MDRRTFVGAAVSALIAKGSLSQTSNEVRRIGLLALGDPGVTEAERKRFWEPARKFGWIEGKNLLVERRFANKPELLSTFAEELVRLKVDAIVTGGTDATLAARNATTTIPIIMYSAGDPVRAGLVASLSRPGGNITGFSVISPELDAKRVELLREMLPSARRVGVLVNPNNPMSYVGRKEYEQVFNKLALEPIFVEVPKDRDLESAIAQVARRQADAVIVQADLFFNPKNESAAAQAALSNKLPSIVASRSAVEAGCTASYGLSNSEAEIQDQRRRYFVILDKVLRGANPADIPIEQPTKFELAFNLKTAKALGLTISKSLLLRADVLIQ